MCTLRREAEQWPRHAQGPPAQKSYKELFPRVMFVHHIIRVAF